MTFYERIEALRKEKGISQGALEKELGFSNGSFSKWRTSMPTHNRLQKLATFFQVSVDYLVTGEETVSAQYLLNEETASTAKQIYENDRVLFEVYRSEDKERLVAYAKKLKALQDMEGTAD